MTLRSNRQLIWFRSWWKTSLSLSLQALLPAAAAAHAGLFAGWKSWERISGRQVDGGCWYWDVHLAGKWHWDGNPCPWCSRLKPSWYDHVARASNHGIEKYVSMFHHRIIFVNQPYFPRIYSYHLVPQRLRSKTRFLHKVFNILWFMHISIDGIENGQDDETL